MSKSPTQQPATRPIAVEDVPWTSWSEGVRFGARMRTLSNTRTTGNRIGVHIEELPPGKQSVPLHYHLLEEEHIWMLEGEVTLRLGDERLRFGAGQFVTFPAGAELGHCLVNESAATARYLVIGNHEPNEVCVYPDSNKLQLRGFSRTILERGRSAKYWDGERSDEPPT
jgi:uncharacterized cupin superfamily protein